MQESSNERLVRATGIGLLGAIVIIVGCGAGSPDSEEPLGNGELGSGGAHPDVSTGGAGTGGALETSSGGGAHPDGGQGGMAGNGGAQCFGYDYHPRYAYGLPGCSCPRERAGICLDGAALDCQDGTWHGVIDGPCMGTTLDCHGMLDTPAGCIELFDWCEQLSSGICGRDPITNLCVSGLVVSSPAYCYTDDAYCVPVGEGLYCTGTGQLGCAEGSDPMAATDCPLGAAWCYLMSTELACRWRSYSPDECQALGGTPVSEPPDYFRTYFAGCPSSYDTLQLGLVPAVGESGVCCPTG